MFVLSNIGLDVTGILAGFGIGGVAIAFASQSFLGDLIAYISIASDKPFDIGDYILINNLEGTVTKIGIKSVRIERNMGEEVIIPNSKITNSELHNFTRIQKRRFDLNINIALTTSNEKLAMIPVIANQICEEHAIYEFVRSSLLDVGKYSFEFIVAVYVRSDNPIVYFTQKQEFIYELRKQLLAANIEFAPPLLEIKNNEV